MLYLCKIKNLEHLEKIFFFFFFQKKINFFVTIFHKVNCTLNMIEALQRFNSMAGNSNFQKSLTPDTGAFNWPPIVHSLILMII